MSGVAIAAHRTELTVADGTPLKTALARSQRRRSARALGLTIPLVIFMLISFAIPVGQMLYRSVYNDAFSANMPSLTRHFATSECCDMADESAFAALAADLAHSSKLRTVGIVGSRVNYEYPGARSLFTASARKVIEQKPPYRRAYLALDPRWGDSQLWAAMRRASSAYTLSFYLTALDLGFDDDGEIKISKFERRIHTILFVKTFISAFAITIICLFLAFPIAHLLSSVKSRMSNILMMFVLIPFWTSLLVRTTSWIVILQSQGVLNDALVWTGVVDNNGRIQMMYNRIGATVAMTHILLPFMVLPIYSVMRTISPSYVRAARSLGAGSWTTFWRVYFPLTMPGVSAGALLVLILAIGYYITPALVGGASGQLIANVIAFHMQKSLNWSLAAALGTLLLFGVGLLYWLYDRLVGIENLKLG